MSVKEPDFNSNLLDRFLVLLEHKGIHPIVYISKMDLLEDGGELDFYQQTYGAIGYDFVTSKEELLPLLTGKVTVFMGQTGVGKSTLLNKIAPDLNLKQEKSQTVWVAVVILLELLVLQPQWG